VTASEIAFLAFGLLLGATGGAAAAAVSRARARPPREIRITVAPIPHPGRPATLATYLPDGDPPPARGGPADPVELGLAPAGDDGRTGDGASDNGSRSPLAPAGRDRAGSGGAVSDQQDPRGPLDGTIRTGVRAGPDPDWVAVPIATGRDPLLSAIVAAGDRRPAGPEPLADERHRAGRERALAAVPRGRPEPASDRRSHLDPADQPSRPPRPGSDPEREPPTSPVPAARAHAGPGPADRGAEPADRGAALEPARRGAEPPNSLAVPAAADPAGDPAADPAGEPDRAVRAGPTETHDPANPTGPAGPVDSTPPDLRGADPCAGARLLVRERCQVAERANAEAAAAAERLRAARRAYDDAAAKADAAAAKADPRAVRAAKEQAQDAFRVARAAARTRAEAEAAARAWLDEINRINREAAAAAREADRHAAVVRELGPQIERLATEADAARILAESAEDACLAARQALAECEEELAVRARAGGPAPTREDTAAEGPPQPTTPGESPAGVAAAGSQTAGPTGLAAAPTPPLPSFEDDTAALVAERDREAAIIRLLRGDHRILDRLVAELAGSDPEAQRRWRLLLADLVDAIIGRAIEANALDFPDDDPFWGRFTQAQARDIAAALASLGYRFDGLGGFVDGRVPSQRDLSLAVGYAGLDPMRIRTWPTEAELARLFERVTIAADEFLIRAAGGLTLSELVELLGHRADDLADLWNAWGRLRPLLLELV
jgi:hypothetical protein